MLNEQIDPTNPQIWIVSTLEVDLPINLRMCSRNNNVNRQFQSKYTKT